MSQVGGPEARSSSLLNSSNAGGSAKTPGLQAASYLKTNHQGNNKTPLAVASQLMRLPDGRLIQAGGSQIGNPSMGGKFTPGGNQRALTPS